MKRVFVSMTLFLGLHSPAFASQEDAKVLFKSLTSLQRMVQLLRDKKKIVGSAGLGAPLPIPPEVEAQAQKLQKFVDSPDCVLTLPSEATYGLGKGNMQTSVTSFHIEISGSSCPVFLSMTVNATQPNQNKITAQYLFEFRALDEEFKKESDIIQISQAGTIFAEMITGSTSQKMVIHVKMTGEGVSQKLGKFSGEHSLESDFAFNFPLDIKANVVTHHTFKVPNEDIQLRSESKLEGLFSVTEKYFYNAAEIDKATFEGLVQGTAFPGLGEQDDASKLPPLQCELSIISKMAAAVVASAHSCLKDVSATWLDGASHFCKLSLEYKKDWVEAKLMDVQTGKTEMLNALYEESSHFKKDLGPYVMQLNCEPVAQCK